MEGRAEHAEHRVSKRRGEGRVDNGMDDALVPEEYEREIHEAVPGSQYIPLREAGHFPMAEQPEAVNGAIQAFLDTRCAPQRQPV